MNTPEKFWDKLSKNYDKRARDKAYELIIYKSKKYFNSRDTILDFGCATGLFAMAFARYVKRIQAFDISSNMLDIARKNALDDGIENITFSQTSLFDSAFKTSSFDSVLALNILLYFKNPQSALSRMHELLKPNGLIITSTACLREKRSCIGVLSAYVISVLKKLKIFPYIKFFSIIELEEHIEYAGFRIIERGVLIDKPATEYYIVAEKIIK